MFKGFPDRPDCHLENPKYDLTCPRRLQKQVSGSVKSFLLLAGMFLSHKVMPLYGGLLDQDIRFVVALGALSGEVNVDELQKVKAMTKMMGI